MTRIFPKKPSSPEEKAANSIFSGDATSAFQELSGRTRLEREEFIVNLAKDIMSGKIETADGKGGIKKVILLPNSMIGILRSLQTIAGEEKKRLAEMFIAYCEKRNWPGTQLKIFQFPGMEPDPGTRRVIESKIINKINYPASKSVAVTA